MYLCLTLDVGKVTNDGDKNQYLTPADVEYSIPVTLHRDQDLLCNMANVCSRGQTLRSDRAWLYPTPVPSLREASSHH